MFRNDFNGCERGIRAISEGIEQIREGLHDIHCCHINEGIHDCREGVCHIEAGLQDITDALCNITLCGNCGERMIRQGIREINKGNSLVLKGTHDVQNGRICRGEQEIAAGLCEDEKGLNHIIEGSKEISFF